MSLRKTTPHKASTELTVIVSLRGDYFGCFGSITQTRHTERINPDKPSRQGSGKCFRMRATNTLSVASQAVAKTTFFPGFQKFLRGPAFCGLTCLLYCSTVILQLRLRTQATYRLWSATLPLHVANTARGCPLPDSCSFTKPRTSKLTMHKEQNRTARPP